MFKKIAESLENPKPERLMTKTVEDALVKKLDKSAKEDGGYDSLAVQGRQPTKVTESDEITEENRYAKTAEAVVRLRIRRKLKH